jgi:hypothetical protein
MRCAVDFNNEFHIATREVGNIRPYGHLAGELEPGEATVFQALPQNAFRTRRCAAQFARPSRYNEAEPTQVRLADNRQTSKPITLPLTLPLPASLCLRGEEAADVSA